ncbi:MAG: hypothetical protein GF331_19855, partial [Chitinivibrionales bacterium]|nr:hypothetical protein [Chitinivibrionales bacterium]
MMVSRRDGQDALGSVLSAPPSLCEGIMNTGVSVAIRIFAPRSATDCNTRRGGQQMYNGLRNSGLPLGGLGTGSVELRSDGFFHEWQIMNNGPWGSGPIIEAPLDTLYFGMQVSSRSQRRSAILGLPPSQNQHLNDPYHIPWIEHPVDIDAVTRFPFTSLDYRFERFPIHVSLEVFSPFIPHDSRHSGLPAAYCSFALKNTGKERAEVALFGALRNLVGYTRPQSPSSIAFRQNGTCGSLVFTREEMPRDANDGGSMVLGTMPSPRARLSYVAHPRSSRDIWEPLRDAAALESTDLGTFAGEIGNVGASRKAQLRQGMPHGVLCQTVRLAPGAQVTLGFVLTWHFPDFAERDYEPRKLKGQIIGHRYAEWYDNASAVYDDVVRKQRELTDRTRAFTNAYYSGTQPQWLLDAVAAQLTTLVKSSWWARDGRFGIWEGLGCCGLQTTDITYYGSFPIVQFFPDIQQSQMRLTRQHIDGGGKVPHMMPGSFSCADVDHRGRIDLIPQFVLLVWRDVLWTGDLNYAREMWPVVHQSLEAFKRFDTDGDGLPNNSGPDQTYDQFPLKGTSAFVGYIYAGALRAAVSLAALLGHDEQARSLQARLDKAMPTLEEQLWNGEYYRLCYDPIDKSANEGVMADQV